MTVHVIAYDLQTPGQNYDDLKKKIKSYGTWCHIQESVWMIESSKTCVEIRDDLETVLDNNDKIFVGKMAGEAAWRGLGDAISKWLKDNL
jgi:CRISPR/Cas system-associated endoribonuclease Cas2